MFVRIFIQLMKIATTSIQIIVVLQRDQNFKKIQSIYIRTYSL